MLCPFKKNTYQQSFKVNGKTCTSIDESFDDCSLSACMAYDEITHTCKCIGSSPTPISITSLNKENI